MAQDISKYLSYEVKREIAGRYFGFRKMIEDDKAELNRQIQHHSINVEQRICLSLARIYILLKDHDLIVKFLELTGMEEGIFYDPYIPESPTLKKKLFAAVKLRGLTNAIRFKNLLLDEYESLLDAVSEYRQGIGDLLDEQETISEEIKLFYRKNDLGNIMDFLRCLDHPDASGGSLVPPLRQGDTETLEQKLRILPPCAVDQVLPIIPPLIPLPQIRRKLKKMAEAALKKHGNVFFQTL